jgi:hypothetical protein
VQRIAVAAAHAVQQCLLRGDRYGQFEVRRSLRRFRRRRRTALAAEAPPPRAKIERFWVHNSAPSGAVTVVFDQMTAALPLSQMSVNLVTARPVPDGGIGDGAETASLACSTLLNSMSMPGNFTVGGSVMWELCAICRTSAAPVGCRRPGSAVPAGPSGRHLLPARGGRAGYRHWSKRIRRDRVPRPWPRRDLIGML